MYYKFLYYRYTNNRTWEIKDKLWILVNPFWCLQALEDIILSGLNKPKHVCHKTQFQLQQLHVQIQVQLL